MASRMQKQKYNIDKSVLVSSAKIILKHRLTINIWLRKGERNLFYIKVGDFYLNILWIRTLILLHVKCLPSLFYSFFIQLHINLFFFRMMSDYKFPKYYILYVSLVHKHISSCLIFPLTFQLFSYSPHQQSA